jgi:hypothetical protein
MAQLESKWIDTRTFDEVTQDTIPDGRYKAISTMIQEDPKLWVTDYTLHDDEISSIKRNIQELKEKIKTLDIRIEKIKNPPKKKQKPKRKTDEDDEEEEDEQDGVNIAVQLERLHETIEEKQGIMGQIATQNKELELQEKIREITIKKFHSLNRLVKHYRVHKDTEYLEKGVHWVCEYGDAMIERETRYKNYS